MTFSVTLAATVTTVLATIVTAVATVMLWRVTKVLARETERMADAGSRPQVVVTIEPNMSSSVEADIHVANTGTASAFDIRISFEPEIVPDKDLVEDRALRQVSLLRPGQKTASWLTSYESIRGKAFDVEVSWGRQPRSSQREKLVYSLDMNDVVGMGWVGVRDPLLALAEEHRKMREEWSPIAKGLKRLQVDTFDQEDRDLERQELEKAWSEQFPPKRKRSTGKDGSASS